jgi:pimeloyl-ACP methyl ester carboxylesterase
MGPIELEFDVTGALPANVTEGRRIVISAWLFFPDDLATLGDRTITMTLLAGGSYDKRYHHVVIPEHPGYSAAEHLTGLGNIVLLTDHLGVSGSSRLPDQKKATRHTVALANHAAVTQFYERLGAGELHPDLPPIADFVRIGGGHSMGAMQTVIQQAAHRSWQAIMFLGYTAQGVHGTFEGRKFRMADLLPGGEAPDYSESDRADQRATFHFGDVPEAVMRADDAIAVATPTSIGFDSIRTDIIKPDAAQIDVPVLFANAERDVSPDPHAEAQFFPRCTDFTLFLLPGSAHCQTFANTRHIFWNRMHDWSRSLQL